MEQIVGRILRQPYTEEQKSKFLNMCYVITSSDDFYGAVDKVISGLNAAGFSDKDVKAIDEKPKEGLFILKKYMLKKAHVIFPLSAIM